MTTSVSGAGRPRSCTANCGAGVSRQTVSPFADRQPLAHPEGSSSAALLEVQTLHHAIPCMPFNCLAARQHKDYLQSFNVHFA